MAIKTTYSKCLGHCLENIVSAHSKVPFPRTSTMPPARPWARTAAAFSRVTASFRTQACAELRLDSGWRSVEEQPCRPREVVRSELFALSLGGMTYANNRSRRWRNSRVSPCGPPYLATLSSADREPHIKIERSAARTMASLLPAASLGGFGKTRRRCHPGKPQATKNLLSRLFEKLQILGEVYPEQPERDPSLRSG